MRPEAYPAQEPLSAFAKAYHDEVQRRGQDLVSDMEAQYGADPYQSIALFAPKKPNGIVLAFLDGGGWTNGHKEWMSFMAPAYTAHGNLFATIGYRLGPAHVFPAGIEDAAAGLAWLVNAAEKHGDPRKLFLGEHSAGGHYAAWLAVHRNWQARFGLDEGVIRGCLPVSGVYRFGEGSSLSMRPRFLGPPGMDEAASPVCHVRTPPPFLMAHGERDFPHLIKEAEEMERALRDEGGEVERLILAGRDHLGASYASGDPDGPYVPHALAWIAKTATK